MLELLQCEVGCEVANFVQGEWEEINNDRLLIVPDPGCPVLTPSFAGWLERIKGERMNKSIINH